MTASHPSGCVLLRGRSYGVVGVLRGAPVIYPVSRPGKRQRAHDVALELGELIGANILLPAAIVRVAQPMALTADDGDRAVGQLPAPTACRVTLAAIAAYSDAVLAEQWEADRRHRREASANRPVRLVD